MQPSRSFWRFKSHLYPFPVHSCSQPSRTCAAETRCWTRFGAGSENCLNKRRKCSRTLVNRTSKGMATNAPSALRPSASKEARNATDTQANKEDTILQYVVLRRDLYTDLKWPLGSVVAQACHAATAALWASKEESITQLYCASDKLESMHKVVLEVKGETQLRNLASRLQEAGIRHRLWIEQPEDFPTCLASAPYAKSTVQRYFKKLKLCNL